MFDDILTAWTIAGATIIILAIAAVIIYRYCYCDCDDDDDDCDYCGSSQSNNKQTRTSKEPKNKKKIIKIKKTKEKEKPKMKFNDYDEDSVFIDRYRAIFETGPLSERLKTLNQACMLIYDIDVQTDPTAFLKIYMRDIILAVEMQNFSQTQYPNIFEAYKLVFNIGVKHNFINEEAQSRMRHFIEKYDTL